MTNNDNDRLMRCFTSAFPSAAREEFTTAKFESICGWDSLRGVTLLALLDDEFGMQIDLPELLELETFGALKTHLLQRGVISQVNE